MISARFIVVAKVRPEEIYHLGAQSFVTASFDDGFSTCQTNIDGTHYMLSAARQLVPHCRFYFAGSSEMFGNTTETPQSETSPMLPRSAYGISKVACYHFARTYREAYGMHVCTGILYNHESPLRGCLSSQTHAAVGSNPMIVVNRASGKCAGSVRPSTKEAYDQGIAHQLTKATEVRLRLCISELVFIPAEEYAFAPVGRGGAG